MRAILRYLGRFVLGLFVVLLLAPTVVPPFLDRVYYRGPPSDHFDGHRFFNPDGEQGTGGSQRRPSLAVLARFFTGRDRAAWPDHVPVMPGHVPARVSGGRMLATWIGHSTVLVQADGLNILTDPIWSERAGAHGLGPKRVRAPGIRFDDLPRIDVVLVSHDHYDHMDLDTLARLWKRDRPLIVTSLGNDTILAGRGIPAVTRDWGGHVPLPIGEVIVERVHHWGSRFGSDRDRALWSGFTVKLPSGNLFFAGDTGWGDGSWPAQAAKDGPFRLAIIPIGAFRPREMMTGNHIGPVEAEAAFERLGAAYGLAVHWGTFRLSSERIDEPPQLLAATLKKRGVAPGRFRALEVGQPWAVPAR